MEHVTPARARQQLTEAADRADLPRQHASIGALFTGGLAVLVAVTLAAITAVDGHPAGVGLSMVAYAALLALLLWWYSRKFRIVDRNWRGRYLVGFAMTMTLYSAGIVWQSFAFPGWAVFAPFCVLVAVPGLVAALRMMIK